MYRKHKYKVETQDITWKTHNDGKNHGSPRAAEYTIREEYNDEENTQRQQPLVLFFTTRGGGYKMEATTSLSLSMSLCYTLCTTFYFLQQTYTTHSHIIVCALSHIYTYMTFRHIYICVLLNRSEPIGTGSEISRFFVSSIRRDMFPNISLSLPRTVYT